MAYICSVAYKCSADNFAVCKLIDGNLVVALVHGVKKLSAGDTITAFDGKQELPLSLKMASLRHTASGTHLVCVQEVPATSADAFIAKVKIVRWYRWHRARRLNDDCPITGTALAELGGRPSIRVVIIVNTAVQTGYDSQALYTWLQVGNHDDPMTRRPYTAAELLRIETAAVRSASEHVRPSFRFWLGLAALPGMHAPECDTGTAFITVVLQGDGKFEVKYRQKTATTSPALAAKLEDKALDMKKRRLDAESLAEYVVHEGLELYESGGSAAAMHEYAGLWQHAKEVLSPRLLRSMCGELRSACSACNVDPTPVREAIDALVA